MAENTGELPFPSHEPARPTTKERQTSMINNIPPALTGRMQDTANHGNVSPTVVLAP